MKNKKLTAKTSALAFIVSFFATYFAVFIFSIISSSIFQIVGIQSIEYTNFMSSAIGQLITSCILYLVMFVVVKFISKHKENKVFSKPSIKKILLYILLACAVFFCLNPIVSCFDTLFVSLGFKPSTISYNLNLINYLISIISLVILPAIVEELLFRGLIFKGLKQNGKFFACFISSLMFSIYHMSIFQTIYPLLFGLVLSVIMYHENNILYCILMHATNNLLSLTLMFFKVNLSFAHWTFVLIAILLLTIFLVVIALLLKTKDKQESLKIDTTSKNWLIISILFMTLIWILTLILSFTL